MSACRQRETPVYIHYSAFHCSTVHYITLQYITLHYATLHYITLHYSTLHYITVLYRTVAYINTLIHLFILTLRSMLMFIVASIYDLYSIYIYTDTLGGFECLQGHKWIGEPPPASDRAPSSLWRAARCASEMGSTWTPKYVGASRNQGHLKWTQQNGIPHTRTPKEDPPNYRNPPVK